MSNQQTIFPKTDAELLAEASRSHEHFRKMVADLFFAEYWAKRPGATKLQKNKYRHLKDNVQNLCGYSEIVANIKNRKR
jgi:isocitrate dehydrogenase kinase/phosphatase